MKIRTSAEIQNLPPIDGTKGGGARYRNIRREDDQDDDGIVALSRPAPIARDKNDVAKDRNDGIMNFINNNGTK